MFDDRLKQLNRLIVEHYQPTICDESSNGKGERWTWGDIESLGYGTTSRARGWNSDDCRLNRWYTGPAEIRLQPWNLVMRKGDVYSD